MNILNMKYIERQEGWEAGRLEGSQTSKSSNIQTFKPFRKGKSSLLAMLLTMAVILAASCAKPGTLTGGPKDEKPPVILGSEPMNGSTQFSAKEFVINFDEYVTVRDAENNILVSPPMKHKPEYSTRGKGIVVRLRDTLHENTTYLFQFKEGIADFNEGNILSSYEYVFSTGSRIDSMTLRGRVLDAFTEKPREEVVSVLAFAESQITDSLGDSVVAKVQPMYMTRCDKEGNFELNHLREGRYLLLALEDANKDLHFDAGEAVGFLDTLPVATLMPPPPDTAHHDTSATDSTMVDTSATDSLAAISVLPADMAATDSASADSSASELAVPKLAIYMSLLKQEAQRVLKSEMKSRGFCEISTQLPLSDSLRISSLDSSLIYVRIEPHRDTLHIWTANKDCDSIVLLLTDTNLRDTLSLRFREKSKGRALATKESSLRALSSSSHPYFDTLWIASNKPICNNDTLSDTIVSVFCLSDSTTTHCALRWRNDLSPQGSTQAMVDLSGKQGEKYKISIPAKQFSDIYGKDNDSLTFNVEYTKAEQYGNILLTITRPEGLADSLPIFIELTDESDKLITRQLLQDSRVSFPHLRGAKYAIRAIVDLNNDGGWTPGNFWSHRQPEPILRFEKVLELRENWDMEERWDLTLDGEKPIGKTEDIKED